MTIRSRRVWPADQKKLRRALALKLFLLIGAVSLIVMAVLWHYDAVGYDGETYNSRRIKPSLNWRFLW